MSALGRHGPKHLITSMWNFRTSREALLEAIGDGLSQTQVGHVGGAIRGEWQPWKVTRDVSTDTLYMSATPGGDERAIPALRITARTRANETQQGISRTFNNNATVTLDALVGYTAPIDEYTILLAFVAHPGWMTRSSEILVHETIVAVRDAVCADLRVPPKPMFQFVSGGWSNLNLSGFGDLI